MQRKFEEAKQQGLTWQALLIEDTQTMIKVTILDLYLKIYRLQFK